MKVQEMLVTPEMAEKWLEGNTHNRHVRDSVVARYQRDMEQGRWLLTHECIAFDHSGTLIDGQHRLYACWYSGKAIPFMIARDAEMDTQAVIDGGIIRTMVDVANLAYDRKVTAMQMAIAKSLAQSAIKGVLTRQEQMAAFERHQDAILFATSMFPKKIRTITVAPVMTVIARAWYTADREKLAVFCDLLTTGKFTGSIRGESGVLLLRNWLLERSPTRSSPKLKMSIFQTIYMKAERALTCWLAGEQIANLFPATAEMFPLPEEVELAKRAPKRSKLPKPGSRARSLQRKLTAVQKKTA